MTYPHQPGPVPGLSEAELKRAADEALAGRAKGRGLWVFAYGALMWDDSFKADAAHPAVAEGFERAYCIWDGRNRGTVGRRALTLGLIPGLGRCTGLAMHIMEEHLRTEFPKVWQHEMPGGYYTARWVQVDADKHGKLQALTFVADPQHPLFAGPVPEGDVADILATSSGEGGMAREYLVRTAAALTAAGVPDPALDRLVQAVAALPLAA